MFNMRLKNLVLLGAAAAFALVGEAAHVTSERAAVAARRWVRAGKALDRRMKSTVESVRTVEGEGGVSFHVVRMKGGGYVVMGADTVMDPVIAFSATGVLRDDPSNPLWSFLKRDFAARARAMRSRRRPFDAVLRRGKTVRRPEERWSSLLAGAEEDEASAPSARKLLSAAVPENPAVDDIRVDALLKTAWAQRDYRNWGETNEEDHCYNYYTPGHAACGCVATVGAQIMRYHEYPTQEVEAVTYSCATNGVSVDLTMFGGAYAWSDMPLVPAACADGCPAELRQAIGKLTYDVGIACKTDYRDDHGSLGYVSLLSKRLVDRFGYANAEIAIFNDRPEYGYGYTLDRLKAAVIPNLDAGLPVVLGINGVNGSHAGVGDGYGFSGEDFYLHINLGWADLDGSNTWYMPPDIDEYDAIDTVIYNIWPTGLHGGSLVSGRILDRQGNAVPGAHVTATDGNGQTASTTTNEKGIYALSVAPRAYLVEVDNGIAQARTNVVVGTCVSTDVQDDGSYVFPPVPEIGNLYGIDLVVNTSVWQTEENPDGTVTVVGVAKTVSGVVDVPSQIDGKDVAALADGVFDGCGDIVRITLPATVTAIGSRAFVGCSNLTSIVVVGTNPAYLTTEDGLLYDRQKAVLVCCPTGHDGPVTLPEGLLEIGDDAFRDCRNVANLTVPAGVTNIGARAFVGSGVRTLTLPTSLTAVGEAAFADLGDVLETVWLEAGETARIRSLLEKVGLSGEKTVFVEIYEVNFDLGGRGSRSGGGEMFQRVQQGQAAELPGVAAPTGWEFRGWFTASEGGMSAEGLPVTSNLTYRAHWKANEYKLVYAPGGAEGKPLEVVLTYDTPYVLEENPFAKPGCYFGGWTDVSGVLHRPGEVVSNLTAVAGATVTYTATWYESALDYAVGGPGLRWETGGDYPWEISSVSGEDCLRSNPNVTNNWQVGDLAFNVSKLTATVKGSAEMRFRYRKTRWKSPFVVTCDGEEIFRDEVPYDETTRVAVSDWTLVEKTIPEGEHEIVFSFTFGNYDGLFPDTFNGVWLDDVEVGQYARLPSFSPATSADEASACRFTNSLAVTISGDLGATIYYTTDGTDPTEKSTVYAGPVELTETTLVKAMATVPNKKPSAVATALYVEDGPVKPGAWTTNADAVRRAAATHGNLIAVVMADAVEEASSAFWKVAQDEAFARWARERGVYLLSADKTMHPFAESANAWFYEKWFYSDKGPDDKTALYLPTIAFFNAWDPDVPVGGGEFWRGAEVNGIKYASTVESLKACFGSFLTERPLPDRDCTFTVCGEGWHEVSFNALPSNATPANVFAGAKGIGEVRRDDKSWKPGKGGTLERLEIGKGYWIQTRTNTVTVSTSGSVNPRVSVDLQPGWNLIGYPLFAEGAIEAVLPTQNVRYVYSEGRVCPGGRLTTMAPGKGYWVHATQEGTFKFASQDGMPPALLGFGSASAASPVQAVDPVPPTIFARVRLTFDGVEAPLGAGVAAYRRSDNGLCGYGEVTENGELTFGLQVKEGESVSFKGWRQYGATNEELVVVVGTSIFKDEDYALPVPGTILDGVWLMDRASAEEAKPLDITFDSNGGEPRTPQTAGLYVGVLLGSESPGFPTPPTRTGYSFAGWYTATSGGERMGDENEICLTDPAVTTLYAQWDDPRILFELADGRPREYSSGIATIDPLPIRADGFQTPKISVSGLPSGLKFASKATKVGTTEIPVNSIYGVPSKAGVYAVKIKATSSERKDAKPEASYVITVGKSDNAFTIAAHDTEQVLAGMGVASAAGEFSLTDAKPEAELDLMQGVNYAWTLDLSVPFGLKVASVKVSGLPSGLKFTAKPVTSKVKSGNVTVLVTNVVANTIYGVPSAASKAGTLVPSSVKVTVTAEGKVSKVFMLKMTVNPMPSWAVGTFSGRTTTVDEFVSAATMTVAASGKISGNFSTLGENGKTLKWKYSKTGFDDTNFTFVASAKTGKTEWPVAMTIKGPDDAADPSSSRAAGSFGPALQYGTFEMWRNVWKDKSCRALPLVKPLEGLYNVHLDGEALGCGYLSAKVDAKGGVKLSGKLPDGTSVSSSMTMVYDKSCGFFIPWFCAPSAYKGGFVSGDLDFGMNRTSGVSGTDVSWLNLAPTAGKDYGEPRWTTLSATGAAYDKTVALSTTWKTPLEVLSKMPGLSISYKKDNQTQVSDVPAVNTNFTCRLEVDDKNKFIVVSASDGFVIKSAGKPEKDGDAWNYDVENVEAISVTYKQDTGLFKGTFVCWYDYFKSPSDEAKVKLTHTSKKISFEGIWVQDAEGGSGHLYGFGLADRIGLQSSGKTYKYKESFPVKIKAVTE